ncbi:unnamed protein product [Camellia sinensis]
MIDALYKFVVKLRYGGRLERIQEHLNVEFTCLGGKPREGTRGLHEFLKVVEIVVTLSLLCTCLRMLCCSTRLLSFLDIHITCEGGI